jgi:hypothetical protein
LERSVSDDRTEAADEVLRQVAKRALSTEDAATLGDGPARGVRTTRLRDVAVAEGQLLGVIEPA